MVWAHPDGSIKVNFLFKSKLFHSMYKWVIVRELVLQCCLKRAEVSLEGLQPNRHNAKSLMLTSQEFPCVPYPGIKWSHLLIDFYDGWVLTFDSLGLEKLDLGQFQNTGSNSALGSKPVPLFRGGNSAEVRAPAPSAPGLNSAYRLYYIYALPHEDVVRIKRLKTVRCSMLGWWRPCKYLSTFQSTIKRVLLASKLTLRSERRQYK